MEDGDEIQEKLELVRAWAAARADVRAVALVGSRAAGRAWTMSDVDLVVLTDEPPLYLASDDWIGGVGAVGVIRTRRWGVLTERRLITADGLELDVGIATPDWAGTDPVDEGTRWVATDGLVALHDPEGLLAALLPAP